MASSEPIATPDHSSLIERLSQIAFRSLSSTFLSVGTIGTLAWLLGFWSLVVRARISTGAWPEPRNTGVFHPEPLSVDPGAFSWHTDIVSVEFMFMQFALPFALLVLLASAAIKPMRQDRRLAGAFILSASLAAVTMFLDPGSFFLWFID